MAATFDIRDQTGIVTLSGSLTAAIAESFKQQFRAWFVAAPHLTRVVIDLGDVSRMDSAGLGALISVLKRVNERGGQLAVARPRSAVRTVFEITCAHRIFRLCATVEEALAP